MSGMLLLVDLVCGQEHRFLEYDVEVLIRSGFFDCFIGECCIRANQRLRFTARPYRHRNSQLITIELRCSNCPDDCIGFVDNKSEILQCGNYGSQCLVPISCIEYTALIAAQLNCT